MILNWNWVWDTGVRSRVVSLHPKNEMAIKTAPEQQLNLTTPFDAIFRLRIDDVVHTVRQTQIYAHASFLRRKKGVTDSQFHAVSKPSQNLWFFHEKIHFGAFEVFWLRTRRRGGTGIFCMYLNEIDGVWQLSAYKLWSPGMSSFFKPPKRYFV